jgi:nitrogen fixation protein FixH
MPTIVPPRPRHSLDVLPAMTSHAPGGLRHDMSDQEVFMFARLAFALSLVLGATAAWAQDHGHSHQGGQEVKIGNYQAELLVKGSDVTLFVNDAKDQKIDASGFTATAVVLAKGNQQKTVQLVPAGDNRLAGKIDFAVEGKFRATVTLKNASGDLGKGRYNLDVAR